MKMGMRTMKHGNVGSSGSSRSSLLVLLWVLWMSLLSLVVVVVFAQGDGDVIVEGLASSLLEDDSSASSGQLKFAPRASGEFPMWPARSLRATSCPIHYTFYGSESDTNWRCCNPQNQDDCIPYQEALQFHPVISIQDLLAEEPDYPYFLRGLSLNNLIQSVIKCANKKEPKMLRKEDLPEELKPEADTITDLPECEPLTPEVPTLSYVQAMLTAIPTLDLIKKKEGYHKTARVLIFGLGAGAAPSMLSRRFPDMKIDVIEVEPTMLAAAKHFFGFRETDNLKVHIGEGAEWLQNRVHEARFSNNPIKPYDIVILDAYDDIYVSKNFLSDEVIRNVKDIVESSSSTEDNGLLVGNIFCGKEYEHWLPRFLPHFAENFPSIRINRVENMNPEYLGEGNCIMLAHDSKFGFGSDRDTPDEAEDDIECDEDGMCSPAQQKIASQRKKVKRLHRGVCDSAARLKTAKRIFDDEAMTFYQHFTSFPFTFQGLDSTIIC